MNKKKLIIILVAAAALGIIIAVVASHGGSIKPGEAVVCLDAGHGGSDNGASSTDGSRLEKDDNLRLTLEVGKILKKKGIKVIYTREDDESVSLEERSDFANKKGATVFVALHRNSADSKVSGIEAWIEKSSPSEDKSLAKSIINAVDKVGYGDNRGVRAGYQGNSNANYAVNAATDCPSCLLEMGFITTDKDNELFDKNFDDYANAIANGIEEYIQK